MYIAKLNGQYNIFNNRQAILDYYKYEFGDDLPSIHTLNTFFSRGLGEREKEYFEWSKGKIQSLQVRHRRAIGTNHAKLVHLTYLLFEKGHRVELITNEAPFRIHTGGKSITFRNKFIIKSIGADPLEKHRSFDTAEDVVEWLNAE